MFSRQPRLGDAAARRQFEWVLASRTAVPQRILLQGKAYFHPSSAYVIPHCWNATSVLQNMGTGTVRTVSRCEQCGRRLRLAQMSCPEHGPRGGAFPFADPGEPSSEVPFSDGMLPGLRQYGRAEPSGRTEFAHVYLARRSKDGGPVLLKVADLQQPSANSLLLRDVEHLRRLGPPHAPRVLEVGTLGNGAHFIATEPLSETTLAQLLVDAPLQRSTFRDVAWALMDAMDIVHQAGLMHGGFRPEDIFLRMDSPPVATFLDLSRARRPRSRDALLGTDSPPIGVEYTAPELMDSEDVPSLASDIYALGIVFFEMLTGRIPFFGNSVTVLEDHRAKRPPRPSVFFPVAEPIEDVVLQCLSKIPEERPASIAALRLSLEGALARHSAPRPTRANTPPPREKRTAGLLFFESPAGSPAVQTALASFSGQLGHAAGVRCVGVFAAASNENPVRLAYQAGLALIGRGLAERVLVDLGSVTIQLRQNGARLYLSPLFSRPEQFPLATDPPGLLFTAAAVNLLPDLRVEALGRKSDRFVPSTGRDSETTREGGTVTRDGMRPLVGRAGEMFTVLQAINQSHEAGRPRIITVVAEPGFGKTHFARAISEKLRAQSKPISVLDFLAPEPLGAQAGDIRRVLLKRALDLPQLAPPDSGRGWLASRLGARAGAEIWPGVALTMGWTSPEDSDVRGWTAPPGVLTRGAARAIAAGLRHKAQECPTVVILDDAQHADAVSLDALERATVAGSTTPLVVCLMVRPEFELEHPTFGHRSNEPLRLMLEPLSAPAAEELCRLLLQPATQVPEVVITQLAARAEGNPLVLVELVRTLKSQGLVRPGSDAGTWGVATELLGGIPDTPLLPWFGQRELEQLSSELAAHARLVSLLGNDVTREEISGVVREVDRLGHGVFFPMDGEVGTRRLLSTGVIQRLKDGRLGFRHARLQTAIAHAVPERQRLAVHRAAVRFYGARPPISEPRRSGRLAFHAERCGEIADAKSAFYRLAEIYGAHHLYDEAERLWGCLLALTGPDEGSRQLLALESRGRLRMKQGRPAEALSDFGHARSHLKVHGDVHRTVEICLDEADCLDSLNLPEDADLRREEALSTAPAQPGPFLIARLKLAQALRADWAHRNDEALTEYEEAQALAEGLGAVGYLPLMRTLLGRSHLLFKLRRFSEVDAFLARALTHAQEMGDTQRWMSVLELRAPLNIVLGNWTKLVEDMESLSASAREAGENAKALTADLTLAAIALWRGIDSERFQYTQRADQLQYLSALDEARRCLFHARVALWAGDKPSAKSALASAFPQVSRALPLKEGVVADALKATLEGPLSEPDARELWVRMQNHLEGPLLLESGLLWAQHQPQNGLLEWLEAALQLQENALTLLPALNARLRQALTSTAPQVAG